MLGLYIKYLMTQATYTIADSGVIIAMIPGYQGLYSQGENYEEARDNLYDAVEGVIAYKISRADSTIIDDIKKFLGDYDATVPSFKNLRSLSYA